MQTQYETYVRRGDILRRRERIGKVVLVVGVVGAIALVPRQQPREAHATASSGFTFGLTTEARRLQNELDAVKGEMQITQAQLDRANTIMGYSARYRIGADIASDVYDMALAESVEPELAFRLVHVESEFNARAVSAAGAIGLTQLMLPTAKYFDRSVTREQLFDRQTNLRLGFRYLHALIGENHGSVQLALLVYNRGPVMVDSLIAMGRDPRNGYEKAVARGYKGRGVID